jgi:hypothetical protein
MPSRHREQAFGSLRREFGSSTLEPFLLTAKGLGAFVIATTPLIATSLG